MPKNFLFLHWSRLKPTTMTFFSTFFKCFSDPDHHQQSKHYVCNGDVCVLKHRASPMVNDKKIDKEPPLSPFRARFLQMKWWMINLWKETKSKLNSGRRVAKKGKFMWFVWIMKRIGILIFVFIIYLFLK